MKKQGYVECDGCASVLDDTFCKYCGRESIYVFMTPEQVNKIIKNQPTTFLSAEYLGRPYFIMLAKYNYEPKEIISIHGE